MNNNTFVVKINQLQLIKMKFFSVYSNFYFDFALKLSPETLVDSLEFFKYFI